MYAYKVMAKNQRNSIEYAESYWFKLDDAEAHIEHMRLCDKEGLNIDPGDDWHYWIAKVMIRY